MNYRQVAVIPGQKFRLDNHFFVQNLVITVNAGSGILVTGPTDPLSEVSGIPQYKLNSQPWQDADPLQPEGNCYYLSTVTGVFKAGDTLLSAYTNSVGTIIRGDTYLFSAALPSNTSDIVKGVVQLLNQSGVNFAPNQTINVSFKGVTTG